MLLMSPDMNLESPLLSSYSLFLPGPEADHEGQDLVALRLSLM